jgi:hypothetical protein
MKLERSLRGDLDVSTIGWHFSPERIQALRFVNNDQLDLDSPLQFFTFHANCYAKFGSF